MRSKGRQRMLISHRVSGSAALGAALATHAFAHTQFRLHVVEHRGLTLDDRLFGSRLGARGAMGRPVVSVVLEGRACLRAHGEERWLERGDVMIVDSKSATEVRQAGYRGLTLEWDVGSLAR